MKCAKSGLQNRRGEGGSCNPSRKQAPEESPSPRHLPPSEGGREEAPAPLLEGPWQTTLEERRPSGTWPVGRDLGGRRAHPRPQQDSSGYPGHRPLQRAAFIGEADSGGTRTRAALSPIWSADLLRAALWPADPRRNQGALPQQPGDVPPLFPGEVVFRTRAPPPPLRNFLPGSRRSLPSPRRSGGFGHSAAQGRTGRSSGRIPGTLRRRPCLSWRILSGSLTSGRGSPDVRDLSHATALRFLPRGTRRRAPRRIPRGPAEKPPLLPAKRGAEGGRAVGGGGGRCPALSPAGAGGGAAPPLTSPRLPGGRAGAPCIRARARRLERTGPERRSRQRADMEPWPLLALACLVLSHAAAPASERQAARVAQLSAGFGVRLFREASRASQDQNLAFSPHGAAAVLAMLQATADGDTRRQITRAMRFSLKERGVPRALRWLQKTLTDRRSKDTVQMAGDLFVQRDLPLAPTFMRRFQRVFRQTVKQVDFSESGRARDIVNAWVKKHTNGMIRGFLQEGALDTTTRLVLVNAIHFKGLWRLPFPEAATRQRVFHKLDGSTVAVPMMEQTAEFRYGEFSSPGQGDYDVIELPYQGGVLSMLIATPFQRDAPLSALAAAIDTRLIAEWTSNMSAVTRLLVLPKFSLESEVDLRQPLEALGMTDMFDCQKANFSRLSEREALFVSRALQKVKIDVSESGTEASSATAAIVYARMAPLEVVLDRPFLFVVRHNPTGTVLFMGRVMEP